MVLPPRGLTDQGLGRLQGEQPVLGKAGVRPALMGRRATSSATTRTFAQNTAQTHPYPAVERREDPAMAMLELLKPAPQCAVDIGDDHVQAVAVGAPRFAADLCIQPSDRSASNHQLPSPGSSLVSSRNLPRSLTTASLSRTLASLGLRPLAAGSPQQPAESSSLSCGPAVHLQLLSTPSHEDAVTFGYKVQTQLRQGLAPC